MKLNHFEVERLKEVLDERDQWAYMPKETLRKLVEFYIAFENANYLEPCHVTGMHNPSHTTFGVCDIQLRRWAQRIALATGRIPSDPGHEGASKLEHWPLPRRRHAADEYWCHGDPTTRDAPAELEAWEKENPWRPI